MKKLFYCSFILLVAACKDKYNAPVKPIATGYLVVEGVINSGQGNTTLQLSRTTNLTNQFPLIEKGANVRVEGQDNSSHILAERGPGQYSADDLNLNGNQLYRLRIKTTTGKEYLSDYAPVVVNPPIDSISWKMERGGVQLYINTHNPLDNTRYYQWQYAETWEIHSAFFSALKYKIGQGPQGQITYAAAYRDSVTFSFDRKIYTCWQSASSRDLLLGSSAKLVKDVIQLPIAFVPAGSRKLSVLYSIQMKQFGWTKGGYEFLEKIRKNSQDIGSIFDAQPSELKGNIHCLSDSTELVIGYVNLSPLQEKRLFIYRQEVPGWSYQPGCFQFEIENNSDSIIKKGINYFPTNVSELALTGGIAKFFISTPECVDCTLIGTNVKPVFWP